MWLDHVIIVWLGQIWHWIAIRTVCLLSDLKLVICIERCIIFDCSLVNSSALCPRGNPDPPGWSPPCWAHCSSLFPLHLSLTTSSPAEPSKNLHKRSAVPTAASFPAETSCKANPDESAARPPAPVAKTALGPALFVASEISCKEGRRRKRMPSLCSHTAWGNILCKNPPIRSSRSANCFSQRLHAMSRLVQQESCAIFSHWICPAQSFSWNSGTYLWTCPQHYLFSRKMSVCFTIVCFTYLLLEGFP